MAEKVLDLVLPLQLQQSFVEGGLASPPRPSRASKCCEPEARAAGAASRDTAGTCFGDFGDSLVWPRGWAGLS